MLCCGFTSAEGQKNPGAHGLSLGPPLAIARQKPASQPKHAALDVAAVPPAEYVPAEHAFAVAEPVPAGQ